MTLLVGLINLILRGIVLIGPTLSAAIAGFMGWFAATHLLTGLGWDKLIVDVATAIIVSPLVIVTFVSVLIMSNNEYQISDGYGSRVNPRTSMR